MEICGVPAHKPFQYIQEGQASHPQSTLSCWKNLPPSKKNSNPPKIGPPKKC